MRKQVLPIVVAIIAITMCTSSVTALTNQGFYWAISEGQQFEYTRHYDTTGIFDNSTEDLHFSIVLDDIPYIPDSLNLWDLWQLQDDVNRSCYFDDGTEKTVIFSWNVVPMGNWAEIIRLWKQNVYVGNEQIINTPTTAGWNYTYSIGNGTGTWTEIYLKSNGVLQTYQLIFDGSPIQNSTELIQLIPNYTGTILLTAAGIGIVGIVIVAFIVIRRRAPISRFQSASEKIIVAPNQE